MKIKLLAVLVFVMAALNMNAQTSFSYSNFSFCSDDPIEVPMINGQTGGTFSSMPGLSLDAVTGAIYPIASTPGMYTITYTVPANGNNPAETYVVAVGIQSPVVPTFAAIAPICQGVTPPVLPTTSINGITGTWSPSVVSNQVTGTYVFVPDAGQCASFETIIINVENLMPTFTFQTYNFCSSNVPALPTTSNNGITGSWQPATITTNGAYTFTPDDGQCANIFVTTFTVDPLPLATVSATSPICEGNTAAVTFVGTPNSIVTYAIDGAVNQTITIGSTGTAVITMPANFIGDHMICLVSVASFGATSCENLLTGCTQITITPEINITPINSVYVCDNYTLPTLQTGNYYTQSGGAGTMLNAGEIITESQLLYVYGSNDCGSDEEYFMVNVYHTIVIPPTEDITVCGAYSVPPSIDYGYYSQPHGLGMPLTGLIETSQTVYLYASTASTPSCVSESSFYVTVIPIVSPVISTENDSHHMYVNGTTVVQPLLLDAEVAGNYTYQWMELHVDIPGATSPTYLLDYHIDGFNHYISVRITNSDTNCVTTSGLYEVGEIPVPAPLGNQDQTFSQGQTLADVVVTGQNVQWYDGLGRNIQANPLPLSTVLVDGVTYYASQRINGYESPDRLAVTVHLNAMANTTFEYNAIVIVPNPVKEELYVQSKEPIDQVEIYNLIGQKLISTTASKVMLQSLPSGVYIVQVSTAGKQQSLRVIKE